MKMQERAQEIVSAILDICRIDPGDKRPQLEGLVMSHLNEIERQAAEKAVVVYRQKTTEATDKVLSETAIGSPSSEGGTPALTPAQE
jgi:hypothetical protein